MMEFALVVLVLQVGGWVVLNQMHGKKYRSIQSIRIPGLRLQRLSGPFICIILSSRLTQRCPLLMFRLQRMIGKLHGMNELGEKMILLLAELMGYSYGILALGCLLTVITGGDTAGLVLGLLMAILIPAALLRDLHTKVINRDQAILMELPELLGRIMLLVGAGETVQRAMLHCVNEKSGATEHPLYQELKHAIGEWNNGYSFQQALEQLSKRCAIQEVTIFTTTVLLNMRRGGSDFVMALHELSQTLWSKRTSISRIRGEQASSKLVFPMALILLTVIVLIGAPAFMIMDM